VERQQNDVSQNAHCGEESVPDGGAPQLAGLEGAELRVGRGLVVLRRGLIRRVVAASDMTAFQTQPEMDPRVTGGETFLAAVRRVRAVVPRLAEVSTELLGHPLSLRYVVGCWNRRTGE